ncbi:hypothetical protein PPYR_12342 [Photinus pyralis]|uniref:RNA 2-O ribose methyltransferase substrate binding domain-containing protein n=1 Tax=Photinus pyralis TaxID=7054 RepID=A0A5N4ADV1_PHOPY|nr:rRNA methyltransferase 3, mitochondrial [Photinus pyralis]KAB0795503.1 hypothetical protein PPYR_12342 [Photinus pyralis]
MSFITKAIVNSLHGKVVYLQRIQTYARWSHRRPRKVFSEDGELLQSTATVETPLVSPPPPRSTPETPEPAQPEIQEVKQKRRKPKYSHAVSNSRITGLLETIIDDDGNLVYTKLKDNNSAISQLLLTVKSRRDQIKKDLALLEGKRLIKEALEAKCTLKSLLFSRKSDVEYLKPYLPKSGAKVFKIPYREIQLWSDLTTAPGLMGIFRTPDVSKYGATDSLPITVICDNIREPGNLGAILRTVAGVGVEKVLLTSGCVDLWDTKVLRSACGAHFHVQIHRKLDWAEILNIVHEMQSVVFLADNKIVSQTEGQDEGVPKARSLEEIVAHMQLLPYYSVQFANFQSVALIIGGETHGLSEESFRLADSVNGVRLHIPLSNNIDSLNAGTALGVILFEIKKQLLLAKAVQQQIKN